MNNELIIKIAYKYFNIIINDEIAKQVEKLMKSEKLPPYQAVKNTLDR